MKWNTEEHLLPEKSSLMQFWNLKEIEITSFCHFGRRAMHQNPLHQNDKNIVIIKKEKGSKKTKNMI
jgi:hypothetical protein